jgi:hypothetical protein
MMTDYREAIRLADLLARFGLPRTTWDPPDIEADSWGLVGHVIQTRKLTGITLAAIQDGGLNLPDEALTRLIRDHKEHMMHALALERWLIRLADGFERSGIEFVVLKGPALAHTVYPEPSWRPFGDLDVLVRTDHWRQACEAVADLGFVRNLPEPAVGFDERFGKAATHTNGDGFQLDLHRTLTLGPFGLWVKPEWLFEMTVPLHVGGRTFARLDDAALLVHAALHASLGSTPPLTLALRDVAQVAFNPGVDWSLLEKLAVDWRATAVIQHAFAATEETFGVALPPQARGVRMISPSGRQTKALRQYMGEQRRVGGMAFATTMAIPGFRAKVSYAKSLALPSREFLTARSRDGSASYVARWRVVSRWITHRSSSALTSLIHHPKERKSGV